MDMKQTSNCSGFNVTFRPSAFGLLQTWNSTYLQVKRLKRYKNRITSIYTKRKNVNEVAKTQSTPDKKIAKKITVTGKNAHTAILPRFIAENLITRYVVMR